MKKITTFIVALMMSLAFVMPASAFDASLMYVRRDADKSVHNDYITIPVNLKYRFSFPVVNRFVVPYLATGPEWSYLIHNTKVVGMDDKKSNFSWNFGIGVELFSHLQIAGSYGLGLSKVYEVPEDNVNAKNRFWTVTAAWLF